MNIVFLERDTLGEDVDLSSFEKGFDVTYYAYSEPDKNRERAKAADILILNKIPVDASLLDGNDRTKLVCLTATGTNNVDFTYTSKRGIEVMNVSGYSTDSVAQHTFALLFYLCEKLREYDDFVRNGEYIKSRSFSVFNFHFNELAGKTFGIIGLGAIGQRVAEIARAFGCRVIYYSTTGRNSSEIYERCELEELLKQADIVSLHCPLTDKTEKIINERTLSIMKKTAILLNLGRGALVDEQALTEALDNEVIAAAGLDVLCAEPMSENNPLIRVKNKNRLLITPHIGWATLEARQRCADRVLENINTFLHDK